MDLQAQKDKRNARLQAKRESIKGMSASEAETVSKTEAPVTEVK